MKDKIPLPLINRLFQSPEGKHRHLSPFNEGELGSLVLSAFLLVSIVNVLLISTPSSDPLFARDISIAATLLSFIVCLGSLVAARYLYFGSYETSMLLVGLSIFFSFCIIADNPKNISLTVGIIAIVGLIAYAVNRDQNPIDTRFDSRHAFIIITIMFIGMSALLGFSTILRYWTYNASTYDFGIFTQMFEYLRTTGLPYTTVERDQMLSHFAIHFSPIYYLALPGYLIFSVPEYLLVLQAIAICSGVYPLFLLCRHYQLNERVSILIALTYLAYPGVIAPAFYDFHENKFLTVLILWMFYFFEKGRYPYMYLFMALTLMVKEDAALYVIFIGLYYTLARKQHRHGITIFISSAVYFVTTVMLMSQYGHGIMDNRFAVYQLPGETGLAVVAKNILVNPGFFVHNLFSPEKLQFIAYMFVPLLFIPLMTRSTKSLILLIPLVVMNLMTLYPYQFNIRFQYTYGVSALLFFLYLQNLSRFSRRWQGTLCVIAAYASIALLTTSVGGQFTSYYNLYNTYQKTYMETAEVLSQIPANAEVTAETFFVPSLYQIKTLYMYPSSNNTEYLVLDTRGMNEAPEERKKFLKEHNYSLIQSGGFALVYKK